MVMVTWGHSRGAASPRLCSAAGSGLLPPDALTIVGPQGRVTTTCVYCSGSETLTLGSTTYTGIVRFTAPVDGTYTLTTETPGANLILAPPALQTVGQTFASLAWIGLGFLLIAAGTVWLIVLLILFLVRSTSSAPSVATVTPPSAPAPDQWQPPSGPPIP